MCSIKEMKKEFKSRVKCYGLGAVAEIPEQLKAGGAGAHTELGSGCPGAHSLSKNSQFAFWDTFFKSLHGCWCSWGFCESVWAGCSLCVLAAVFAVSASLSASLSSLLCHELNMSPRLECCIPAPSAEALLACVQHFGWAQCKLHVLRPLAVAPAEVLAVFSLLCKTCFEQFISWP